MGAELIEQPLEGLELRVLRQRLRFRRQLAQPRILRRSQSRGERGRRAAQPAQEAFQHRARGQFRFRHRRAHVVLQRFFSGCQLDVDAGQLARRETTDDRAPIAQKARRESVTFGEVREQRLLRERLQLGIVGKQPRDAALRCCVSCEQGAHFGGEVALPRQPRAQFLLGRRRRRIHQPQQRMVFGRIELQRRRRQE